MKNIVLTGASSGIGFQTALSLAEKGGNHIIAIARSADKLLDLTKASEKFTDSKITSIVFDISKNDIQNLVQQIGDILNISQHKTLDIIINNAGFLVNKSFVETNDLDWQQTFETNLFAPARLIRNLLPFFDKKLGGHIVNIGSMGGIQGTEKFPGLAAYSASKGAINILTESLAVELRDYNISVNAINPGSVQTEMLALAFPGFQASVQAEEMGEFIARFTLLNQKLMSGRLIEVSLRN